MAEQMTLTEARGAVERYRGSLRRIREQAEVVSNRAVGLGANVALGAAVGAARKKWGEGPENKIAIPGTRIDADLAAGVVLALAGVTGMAGKQSEVVTAVGSGVLTGYATLAAYHGVR